MMSWSQRFWLPKKNCAKGFSVAPDNSEALEKLASIEAMLESASNEQIKALIPEMRRLMIDAGLMTTTGARRVDAFMTPKARPIGFSPTAK